MRVRRGSAISGVRTRLGLNLVLLGAALVVELLAFQQKSVVLLLLCALLAIPVPGLLHAKAFHWSVGEDNPEMVISSWFAMISFPNLLKWESPTT